MWSAWRVLLHLGPKLFWRVSALAATSVDAKKYSGPRPRRKSLPSTLEPPSLWGKRDSRALGLALGANRRPLVSWPP